MSIVDRPVRPTRTRIKFCGMTRGEDLAEAVDLGVDAVGLILVPGSPRALDLAAAAALRAAIPPLVSAVVLLRNPAATTVQAAIEALRPDLLQFHGEEPEAFCRQFGVPYLKAIAMAGAAEDLPTLAARYRSAAALLLDGHAPGALGGQGQSFDWHRAIRTPLQPPAERAPAVAGLPPLMLAGGLTPATVATAIAVARPYAVDVSSGIEAAPGRKDSGKMRAFVAAVRRADAAAAATADSDSRA